MDLVTQRVRRELQKYKNDEGLMFIVGPIEEDRMMNLDLIVDGPEGTVYEGGTFFCELRIPNAYPEKAPDIKFRTKVYHPNIESQNGRICFDMMKWNWNRTNDIKDIAEFILTVLAEPDWEATCEYEMVHQYKTDPERFAQTARDWVWRYAQ
jgi:ubiquitin-protein ligase